MIKSRKFLRALSRMPSDTDGRIAQIMRLERNEWVTPFDQSVIDAVINQMTPEEIVAYPALGTLYQKLEKFLNVQRENILLCAGSDTGIKSVFEVYVEEGDEVVTLSPSYGMFSVYCDMFAAVKVSVGYDRDFNLPKERIIKAINTHTKLVVLANPNHTGTVINENDLCAIVEHAAKHESLVLVDEAYYVFFSGTMIPHIRKYDNLIIVRTFSKAYGMAGLRVGYLVSHKENIDNLNKVRLTHEISSFSAKFAEYLLDNPDIIRNYVDAVEEGKRYLEAQCAILDIQMISSETNFIFLRFPKDIDSNAVVEKLKQKNIHVKGPFHEVPLEGLIRVTVGPIKLMGKFIDVLKDVLH